VLIVVEAGTTMFEPRAERWDRVYDALMEPDSGVVQAHQDRMRLGFASFSDGGALGQCSQIGFVPPALDNRETIDAVYSAIQSGGSSPSGDSLSYLASTFGAEPGEGRKYMVLVLAGDPETCTVENPECGQDAAIAAVQRARSAGISTLVLGVGDFVAETNFCEPAYARCNLAHLEDLANAGVGQGVAAPPESYPYSQCIASPPTLEATYGTPGDAPYYTGATAEEVSTALGEIFARIASGEVP